MLKYELFRKLNLLITCHNLLTLLNFRYINWCRLWETNEDYSINRSFSNINPLRSIMTNQANSPSTPIENENPISETENPQGFLMMIFPFPPLKYYQTHFSPATPLQQIPSHKHTYSIKICKQCPYSCNKR